MSYQTAASDFLPAFLGVSQERDRQAQMRQENADRIAQEILEKQKQEWAQNPANPENQLKQAEVQRALSESQYYTERLPAEMAKQDKALAAAQMKQEKADRSRAASEAIQLFPKVGFAGATIPLRMQGWTDQDIQPLADAYVGDREGYEKEIRDRYPQQVKEWEAKTGIPITQYNPSLPVEPPPRNPGPMPSRAQMLNEPPMTRKELMDQARLDEQTRTNNWRIAHDTAVQQQRERALQQADDHFNRTFQAKDSHEQWAQQSKAIDQRRQALDTKYRGMGVQGRLTYEQWTMKTAPAIREYNQLRSSAVRQLNQLRQTRQNVDSAVQKARATLAGYGVADLSKVPTNAELEEAAKKAAGENAQNIPAILQNLIGAASTMEAGLKQDAMYEAQIRQVKQQTNDIDNQLHALGIAPTTRTGKPKPPANQQGAANAKWGSLSNAALMQAGNDPKRRVNWAQHIEEIRKNPRATAEERAWVAEFVRRGLAAPDKRDHMAASAASDRKNQVRAGLGL